MRVKIYTDGTAYYTEMQAVGGMESLCWLCDGGRWSAGKAQRPVGVREAMFDDIPDELQEELLAFAARAAAIGTSSWNFGN